MIESAMILAKGATHPAVQVLWWSPGVVILGGVVGYVLFALRRRGLSFRSITTLVFAALFTAVVSLAMLLLLGRYVYFDSLAFSELVKSRETTRHSV